ncbi:MAG TPA: ABC transporter substrate-binding protein [Clostridia bacterium]|nr:ABC transporter substrate-binding protein [Clostridia bacterium]
MKKTRNRFNTLLSTLLIFTMLIGIMTACTPKSTNPTNSDTSGTSDTSETNKDIEPKTKIITDSAGRKVEIPTKIEKVVTVGPVGVLNCFVFTMGEGETIANGLPPRFAQSDRWKYHSIFNPAIATNPVVEDGNAVSMEGLIEIDPDIVLTMDEKTAEDIFNSTSLPAIVLNWKDPEDVKEAVNLLGQIYNKPNKAEEYSKYFDDTLAKINDTVSGIPDGKKVRVLNASLGSLSRPHIIAEWWITEAGGISVTGSIESERLEFSLEQLLKWNPEVIIVTGEDDIDLAYSDERFKDIEAVKNKKIYATPTFGHVWTNRTMEQPLTVLWAAKLFYPEQFKNIDINKELKLFSEKFFSYKLSDEECEDILGDMK